MTIKYKAVDLEALERTWQSAFEDPMTIEAGNLYEAMPSLLAELREHRQARGAQLEPAPQEKLIYVGVRSTTAQSTVNFVEPDEELERALNNWFDANPNLEESSQMDLAMAAYRLGRESRQEKPLAFVDKDVWALVKSKLENGIDSVGFFRMIRHSNKDIPLYTSPPAQPDSVPREPYDVVDVLRFLFGPPAQPDAAPREPAPEMIKAGAEEIKSQLGDEKMHQTFAEQIAEETYKAMIAAQEKV